MKRKTISLRIGLLIILASVVYSCAVNPVTGRKELMLVSEEQERAMGLQYNPQVLATMGVYEDSKLQAFINEKGKQMGRISHRPNLDYQFKIVDSPVVNAFAVPGGFVYFTRGIMAHFNSEAEFAGVLGHEIGHVTARHSAAQQSKQKVGGLGLMIGMLAVPKLQQFGGLMSKGMQLAFLKFGRDDESQSDELGVAYSTKIGYDAHQMADFFSVLLRLRQKSSSGGVPTFLSTHPNPANRYSRVHQLANETQKNLKSKNLKVNRNSYLRMIDGLVYGEDPSQGFVENSVFYHPKMKFRYPIPQGWQFQNTPSQIKMGSKDGKAMIVFALAGKEGLSVASQKALQELKLQVVERKNTKVNGLPALMTVSSQQAKNQQGQVQESLRVLSTFVLYNGNVYAFHGVTSPNLFNTYQNVFASTMKGFRRLTEYSKLNKKPERIRIKTVMRTTSVQNALLSMGVPRNRLDEVAILNNMDLNKRVEKGTLLKTIGH